MRAARRWSSALSALRGAADEAYAAEELRAPPEELLRARTAEAQAAEALAAARVALAPLGDGCSVEANVVVRDGEPASEASGSGGF